MADDAKEKKKAEEMDETALDVEKLKTNISAVVQRATEAGDGDEGTVQKPYDHNEAAEKINQVCHDVIQECTKMRKPYKFVCTATIVQKCGALVHVQPSMFYGDKDTHITEKLEISDSMWLTVTVFCLAL